MDKVLLLEEENNALQKVELMGMERKKGEKSLLKSSKGFIRWEKEGNREGTNSKLLESEVSEKKVVGGGRLS